MVFHTAKFATLPYTGTLKQRPVVGLNKLLAIMVGTDITSKIMDRVDKEN